MISRGDQEAKSQLRRKMAPRRFVFRLLCACGNKRANNMRRCISNEEFFRSRAGRPNESRFWFICPERATWDLHETRQPSPVTAITVKAVVLRNSRTEREHAAMLTHLLT